MNNIYLVGMPGCGKTTIASDVSEKVNIKLIDLDDYITKREGKTIEELFALGENIFRQAETKALREVSQMDGVLVATGGGVVVSDENIDIMKESGKVIFIDAKPEFILDKSSLSGRPLLKDKGKIFELYNSRIELYRKSAHYTVANEGFLNKACSKAEETIRKIIKEQSH